MGEIEIHVYVLSDFGGAGKSDFHVVHQLNPL